MTVRAARIGLALIIFAFVLLTLAYSSATPLGEAPDEPTHIQYVLFLREEGRLPRVLGYEGGLPQGKHPPLYYAIGALLTARSEFETIGFVRNRHFSHQLDDPPVAGYFVHRGLDAPIDLRDAEGRRAVALLRLVSLVSGLLVVAATWWLGRETWPDAPEMALAAAACAAFMPGYLFFSGVFNNDALATAAVAIALVLAVRLVHGHDAPRDLVVLGGVLGLGLITKLTTLPAVGFVGLAVLARAWRVRPERPLAWIARSGAWIGVPAAAIAGWWIARNMVIYGVTDPLGTTAWSESIVHQRRQIPLLEEIGTYWRIQFTTFWGRFGWGSIPLAGWVYGVLAALCGSAVVGLGWLAVRGRIRRRTRWALGLILAAVLGLYAGVFRLALEFNLIVAHGRYFYTALSGLSVLMVSGLFGWAPDRVRRVGAIGLTVGMLALGWGSYHWVLADAFVPPRPATAAQRDSMDAALGAVIDGRLELVGYRLDGDVSGPEALAMVPGDPTATTVGQARALSMEDAAAARAVPTARGATVDGASRWSVPRVVPGRPVTVTLFWRTTRDFWDEAIVREEGGTVARDDVVFAHLVDAEGEVIARSDRIPFEGDPPTMAWPVGEVFAQPIPLTVDSATGTGRATLLVGAYIAGRPSERLPIAGDGIPMGDTLHIGPWLTWQPKAPPDREPLGIFRAPHVNGDSVTAGDTIPVAVWGRAAPPTRTDGLTVTLGWSLRGSPNTDEIAPGPGSAFLHLEDDRGNVVAQRDGPPTGPRYPPAYWLPGEYVEEVRTLEIPGDMEDPGRLRLITGLYEPGSSRRWSGGPPGVAGDDTGRGTTSVELRIPPR